MVSTLTAGRRLAPLITLLILSGCGGTVGMAAIGGSAYTLGNTKKLPIDYLASSMTGKECSALEFEKTGTYCTDPVPPPTPADAAPHYCYRSLGDVDCHTTADPYHNRNRQITDPPRSTTAPPAAAPAYSGAATVPPPVLPAPLPALPPVALPPVALPKATPGVPRPLVPPASVPVTPGNRPRAADASSTLPGGTDDSTAASLP